MNTLGNADSGISSAVSSLSNLFSGECAEGDPLCDVTQFGAAPSVSQANAEIAAFIKHADATHDMEHMEEEDPLPPVIVPRAPRGPMQRPMARVRPAAPSLPLFPVVNEGDADGNDGWSDDASIDVEDNPSPSLPGSPESWEETVNDMLAGADPSMNATQAQVYAKAMRSNNGTAIRNVASIFAQCGFTGAAIVLNNRAKLLMAPSDVKAKYAAALAKTLNSTDPDAIAQLAMLFQQAGMTASGDMLAAFGAGVRRAAGVRPAAPKRKKPGAPPAKHGIFNQPQHADPHHAAPHAPPAPPSPGDSSQSAPSAMQPPNVTPQGGNGGGGDGGGGDGGGDDGSGDDGNGDD